MTNQVYADFDNKDKIHIVGGDILKYVNSKLSEVQRPDGTLLRDIKLDDDGNIVDTNLRLPDGFVQAIQNQKTIGGYNAAGDEVIYDAFGQTEKVTSKPGSADELVTNYLYTKNAEISFDKNRHGSPGRNQGIF